MRTIVLTHDAADRPFVRRLAERLAESAAVVWLDEARSEVGDSLADAAGEAVIRADVAAAVVSRSSTRSAWVQKLASAGAAASPAVVPVVVDDCEVPGALAGRPCADFRDPEGFDTSVARLAATLELEAGRGVGGSGAAVEWTGQEPRLFGRGIVIPPSEVKAVMDGWRELLPEALARERERGTPPEEAGPAAILAAVTGAFTRAYGRAPGLLELAAGSSELSRKFDVLYLFFEAMYGYCGGACGPGER